MGVSHGRSAGFSAPHARAPVVNHGGRFGTSGTRFNSSTASRFSPPSGTRFNSSSATRSGRPPATRFSGTPSARFNGSGTQFRSAPGSRYSHAPGRVSSSPRFDSRPAYRPGVGGRNYSRPGFHRPIHGIGVGARPRYWAGGYYHGYYWPRAHYRQGYVRFVTVLPAYYSTFWFAGVPYYYWNDIYYTWSPSEYGYVATDPPPVVDDDSSDSGSAQPESSDSSSLYIYPRNGQSEEQTATDRYECHQWAAGQTGFDPTRGADQSAGSTGPDDYRRAMIACLDARGYSAR